MARHLREARGTVAAWPSAVAAWSGLPWAHLALLLTSKSVLRL